MSVKKCARTYRDEVVPLRAADLPIRFVRHHRARHYVLRIGRDGQARVTLPPYGTKREALAFALGHRSWLEAELEAYRAGRAAHRAWGPGDEILFRGEPVRLEVEADLFGTTVRFADQVLHLGAGDMNLKRVVEARLRGLAREELPLVALALGRPHHLPIKRVVVRGQRTLWGSCSTNGTISLNWRLVHAPPWVRDYVVVHELMHLREMNHSAHFWGLVARVCPRYHHAEKWLRAHAFLLAE